uniref:28S ribosomal protein S18a, mitochondrial n=1 Tax=Romanomermis culicivorax TaxID=13658 RepID=A0A915ICP1_ROMCU
MVLKSRTAFNFAASMIKRNFKTSSTLCLKQIQEVVNGKTIEVRGVNVKSDREEKLIEHSHFGESCVLCRLDLKIKYSDVLILEQFMRPDGSVLPREVTGLCVEQQEKVENCILQAHWSGLFPDKKPADYNAAVEESEWRRYKRYWDTPEQLFDKTLKTIPGSFAYIRRY